MKKILITGGAGFLGSNLCRRLLREGNFVICFDNLYTGRKENIHDLLENPCFEFVHEDVQLPILYECDEIYNLACPASPVHYQSDPVRTIRTSFLGALNVLDTATKNKARVLQASTSEVYGDPMIHPQPENYWGNVNPTGIRSCYDEGKRAAETLFFDYHRQYGTEIKVIRIFNTYGPGMLTGDGRVVSNFIVQALTGKDLTVFGTGTQTRSFCYVDDLVDGMLCMMRSRNGFTGPVNLGNPEEHTMLELAETVLRLCGSSSRIIHAPLPQDDPVQRKPIIDLAKRELGWTPSVSLEEGLLRTIEYFRGELAREARRKDLHA